MKTWKKALSLVLAVLMVVSAVSISAILAYHLPMKEEAKLGNNVIIIEEEPEEPSEEKTFEEQDFADKNPVPDEEIYVPEEKEPVSVGNLNSEPKPEPEEEPEDKSEFFDEDNNIKIPFDQIYEEEFEEGAFAYDDKTLMIKVGSLSSEREKALGEAGILKLEEMIVLEDSVWYVAYIKEGGDITEAMEKVRALDFIKVAEYNFEYQTTASIIDSTPISGNVTGNASVNDQWYLKSCGVQSAWKYLEKEGLPVAGEGVVVAVIDTGVDFDHIDLAANMWKNTAEIPDNGRDDDGNGYVDDYYGVDVVDKRGNGDDDHGHGTHVAGIIAAVNNKEGIAGIAYNSKIMAVKAGNASGHFLQSDIAKAILYAYENGAEVINMSFGGSASSVAVQDALAVAYSRCVLVAAAGNDGLPNEYVPGWQYMPTYPGALGYVLGVMAVDQYGRETSFTNWDVKAFNGVEYEMYAPGSQMISTIPNNNYATWSGTSMAAPVASAIAANLRGAFGDRTVYPTKFIYGQLASTSEIGALCLGNHGIHNIPQVVDMYSALTKLPKPEVDVIDFAIFDTEKYSANNNGDGVIDSGETFELGFTLKNKWGKAENAIVTVDSVSQGGVANPYVTFGNDTVNYGEVGTYSEKNAGKIFENDMHIGWNAPFMVTVSNECPNDYILTINYTIKYENGLDEKDNTLYETKGSIEVVVRRGTLVPDDISEDMTLTADKLWIVPYSVLVREGVTLTVEAGTNIQFYCADASDPYAETGVPEIQVAGTLLFEGTEDNHIKLYPSELYGNYAVNIYESGTYGTVKMKYCDVVNPRLGYDGNTNDKMNWIVEIEGCEFSLNYTNKYLCYRYFSGGKVAYGNTDAFILVKTAENCSFKNIIPYGTSYYLFLSGNFKNCIFSSCEIDARYIGKVSDCVFTNCNGTVQVFPDSSFEIGSSFLQDYTYSQTDLFINFIEDSGAYLRSDISSSYLNSTSCRYFIGLYFDEETGEYKFTDGTEVSDYVKSLIVPGERKFGAMHHGKIWFTEDEPYTDWDYFYYNDPNNLIPNVDSKVERKFAEYISGLENYPNFTGNVILNDLSGNTPVENWFKVYAPSDEEHIYTFNLGGNYWGTTNTELIEKSFIDFGDDKSRAQLNPGNVLTEAPSNVWPFVVKAGTVVDGIENIVMGEGEVKFFVEFNRDMDTSIPLSVSYGSTEPYADYTVEGEFVSPRRWEGTAYVSTLIEGGTQYFRIGNGKAADSFQKLYTDSGRFTFEIDMTEALAMNLQATAEDTHIHLEWFQDDFDTLMGYNVYRSTSEDGLYTKLNDVIIPADVTTFDDYEIEPGVVYYYNFTVVKTDLTESVPSGKQSLMSKDTMAPDIYHSPVYNAFANKNLVVSATVTDNVVVDNVKLYYRVFGASDWTSLEMNKSNDKYSAIIPASSVTTAGVEYYIEAFDGISYTYKGGADEPYYVSVQVSVDDNDKGDVDGDGVITNKDALILLQGINDLYNLNAEEFARADINGNGIIEAVEALRILQYVSGKITSVLF